MTPDPYPFDPARHRGELAPLLAALAAAPRLTAGRRDRLLARHPKDGRGFFSKAELLAGLRWLETHAPGELAGVDAARLRRRLRGKPVRSVSGVAVVTVLTRPHPCPGHCVFCPSDVRMPKSYLADEPGCQRAAANDFDPYRQVWSRLRALDANGHPVDKVELLVLGGTWSSYPERYRVGFVTRCLEAMNDFGAALAAAGGPPPRAADVAGAADAAQSAASWVDGTPADGLVSYNRRVAATLRARGVDSGSGGTADAAAWERLRAAQRRNEGAGARCVGLVLETRPDHLDAAEVLHLRRLGCTRVQVGVQSLDDGVLAANRRGHDVAATRDAFHRLRAAGFKIQAHWMANLLGSDPRRDAADFRRLFADPGLRPDELKIYPCSLVESAELMRFWESGAWRPYDDGELLDLVVRCMAATPPYCRLSRVVRDIPGGDVVSGSRVTNLRQVAEDEMARRGLAARDVRAREVRGAAVEPAALRLAAIPYATSVGEERFLRLLTPDGALAGFLRLSLPRPDALDGAAPPIAAELAAAAVIREVHVYGRVARLGTAVQNGTIGDDGTTAGRRHAQHRGLGRRLVRCAADLAAAAGYRRLAVISALGTRRYYRRLGFTDGDLYQHLALRA